MKRKEEKVKKTPIFLKHSFVNKKHKLTYNYVPEIHFLTIKTFEIE